MPPTVSFEFFPPQSLQASFKLWDTLQVLKGFGPEFVSVTYGAGGTTRRLTRDAVKAIHENTEVEVAAHLTCVGQSKTEVRELAKSYAAAGIDRIVALRGDKPDGMETSSDQFETSIELIRDLKNAGNFHITVGAYPDSHPEDTDLAASVDYLKQKFDAGADAAITQFFFEAETFLRFRDLCDKAGITKPIIPGILPIENWNKTKTFANQCGVVPPKWLDDAYRCAIRDDREALLSVSVGTELCADLIEEGVEHLHYFTLNTPDLTREICVSLGLSPQAELAQVA